LGLRREAGVSYRSYGEFVDPGKGNAPATTKIAALEGHFDPLFPAFDMDYSDIKRAERFIAELNRFEAEGDMPRLQILRLPNDHTSGTSVGKLTPTAFLAENDLAFGMVIEALSKSKFWPQTAIFVVGRRRPANGRTTSMRTVTIAFAISPDIRRGLVDSTMYSHVQHVADHGVDLGIAVDVAVRCRGPADGMPVSKAQPDLRPYVAEAARVSLEERNAKTAWAPTSPKR